MATNNFYCQMHGKVFRVSNASVNRMLRALRKLNVDLIAYKGNNGFTLISSRSIQYRDFSDWYITLY